MSKEFTPSPEQQAFFDWVRTGSGSCVLEAVAGAGKTTTLVRAVSMMSGSVFLGAYNKKMGAELKDRVKDLPNARDVRAGTFHSAGYGAIRKAIPDVADPDDKKVPNIVRRLAERSYGEGSVPEGLIPAVCQLVSLAKQTGFGVVGLVHPIRPVYWTELIRRHDVMDRLPENYPEGDVATLAAAALDASNADPKVIDFDDMVYLPLLLDLRMWRNDWVLVDEAQDTNAARRALAAKMLRRGGRLVAVGDPHQAIYGFTGADNRSLDMIREQFGAVTLRLSVSWRCPRSVVALARTYVGHIEASPTAAEGSVSEVSYSDMVKSVRPGQAVLCRFNAPLVELCFRLIRAGVPAKIEGRSIGEGLAALVGRWKVRTLDALETRLASWMNKQEAKLRDSGKPDWESKLEKVQDQHATVLCLVERAREQGIRDVDGLKAMILSMFADVGSSPSLVVLSSVHRSKGLEWPVVHVLGLRELMPSRRAKQEWQKEQEINLCYVAVTRAQESLVSVAMPSEADKARRPAVAPVETKMEEKA